MLCNLLLKGKVAICDISRSPHKTKCAFYRWDDLAPTLTCGNAGLLVISLGEGIDFLVGGRVPSTDPGSKPEIFRLLFTEERLRCHGFPHFADYGLTVRGSVKASGNAYSVPAVGRIMAPYLKALIDTDALTEVPLIKPAVSAMAKGQTTLGSWLKMEEVSASQAVPASQSSARTVMSQEDGDDESLHQPATPSSLSAMSGLDAKELHEEIEAWELDIDWLAVDEAMDEESEGMGNGANEDDEAEEEEEQAASAAPSTLKRKFSRIL